MNISDVHGFVSFTVTGMTQQATRGVFGGKIAWPPGHFREKTKKSPVFFDVIFDATLMWITEKELE